MFKFSGASVEDPKCKEMACKLCKQAVNSEFWKRESEYITFNDEITQVDYCIVGSTPDNTSCIVIEISNIA